MPPKQPRQTTRTFTATTFTKAMRVRPFINIHGVDTSKKWPSRRIYNEATALKLVGKYTSIPVPKVLEVGEGTNGTYLTVERVDGIQLDKIGQRCRQPVVDGYYLPEGHTAQNCDACQYIANSNAEVFMRETVVPQLKALRSDTTGLNGIVIPMPWITEFDRRAAWESKKSKEKSNVFCHGDGGPQNIMCDPVTLMPRWVVDWENAGYYPEEFADQWCMDMAGYIDMYRDEEKIASLVSLLE